MKMDFPNSAVLLQKVEGINLYQKLVVQLQKDFTLANVAIDLSENTTPANLKTTLHEKIYLLLLEKFPDYLNLLYVIDVPEKAFKEMPMTDVVEVAERVTLLVLKREFQKVLLKAKYA